MIAIICAAGSGTRMKELTGEKPKLLFEVNGKILLKHVLDNLVEQEEIGKKIIVVGENYELIKKAIGTEYRGSEITYVFNEHYHTKGNMSSLWAAREYVGEDIVFTVGDLIISKKNVERIVNSKYSASILVDKSETAKQREDVLKIVVREGRVEELRKNVNKKEVYGAACGFYKFKLDAAKKFYEIIRTHFEKGENDLPFNLPIEELCQKYDVFPVESDGSFCIDIDTPEDLEKVERELKRTI